PFDDETFSGAIYSIKNIHTGQEVGGLTSISAHLAKEHGFFEGNVAYRFDPEKLIEVLEMDKMYPIKFENPVYYNLAA
ncbi:MAG: hypothetical protein KJ922_06415, partial [Nanoarchaeota archaeon]|nr:hypothetical protein [Nanoarchaeota archaeon]